MSAANAVDISVLLGLVDWDLWIRTGLLGGAACSALCSFIICVNIIREVAREKKQEKRQKGQCPRKPNYLIRLFFHSTRRDGLLIRDNGYEFTGRNNVKSRIPFVVLSLHFVKNLLLSGIHRIRRGPGA